MTRLNALEPTPASSTGQMASQCRKLSQTRPVEQSEQNTKRVLKSPAKVPKFQKTKSSDTEQPKPRQQRLLKLPHVDSLLLHPVQSSPNTTAVSKEQPLAPRRSPVRKAQVTAQSRRIDTSADEDSASDIAESEWNKSEVSTETTSFIEEDEKDDSFIFSPVSALKSNRITQKSLFRNGNSRTPVIDLTGPARNLFQAPTFPKKRSETQEPNIFTRPSSSSDSEPRGILRFSPPQFKRPSTRPPPSQPRSRTPSPPPFPTSPSKSRLASPTKKIRIPPTPHRPSIDAFWNPEVVSAWNEEYSPRKTIASPRKIPLPDSSSDEEDHYTPSASPSASPRRKQTSPQKSPQKTLLNKREKARKEARKVFETQKAGIAERFLQEMEVKIGGGRIEELTRESGGVAIVWSKKLNSTAGRANWKREGRKVRGGDGEVMTVYKHIASIELAEKVIDDEHRLLNVLAHEYCHLLNFMVSNVRDQPHGASFKQWASKVTAAFEDRGIEVTTKHSYEIIYKYAWVCSDDDCATEYERHSKSIDPTRYTCGKCKGKLVQIRPVPRRTGKDGDSGKERAESEYQKFVKDQFAAVRKELDEGRSGEKSPMKDVMREVGVRYRNRKLQLVNKTAAAVLQEEEEVHEGGGDGKLSDLDKIARKLDFLALTNDD